MQFDIKTAFLYGELDEDVYMQPPEGTNINPNLVCKLKKSLYGLKQAPKCWNKKFDNFLKEFGFEQCKADKCVYSGKINTIKVLLILFVDDGLIISKNKSVLNVVLEKLKGEFEITISELNYFVGLEIKRNRDLKTIFIHQNNYIEQIVERFNLKEAKSASIPADPHTTLTKKNDDEEGSIEFPYREAVGCLIFAAIATRPDISYATAICSRFLENPTNAHCNAVKQIFRYLKNTSNYGIEYNGKFEESNKLIGYSDSDFANDPDTRKSISGYVFKINDGAITWSSQRQQIVTLSTTEAEYVAAAHATKEATWLRQMLYDIGEEQETPTTINIDNQSAIRLVKNNEFHKRTKHISVKFHFIREKYENKEITVKYVETDKQVADLMTKALSKSKFNTFRSYLGIKN